jgi:hypothetical protein
VAKKVNADKAVILMQFYLGSVDYDTIPNQQKFYTKVVGEIAKLAAKTGQAPDQIWKIVEERARSEGIVRPLRGRDT